MPLCSARFAGGTFASGGTMKYRTHRPVLTFAFLAFFAGCEKGASTNDTATAPSAETAKSVAPEPGMVPAAGDMAAQVKKLGVQVITGSEEGFLVNSTIITGEHDAVLVDAQFTLADAKKVADAVAATNKALKIVYVTHSHPDHYFGFPAIKERFPNARLLALPQTIMDIQKTWEAKVKQWKPMYKDGITATPTIPEPIAENSIDLEGQKLEIAGSQQGDSADNSYVWIPSQKTVITGDIVYDAVFPWTAETTPESRKAWTSTLDKLSALHPEKVIPGHMKADRKLDPSSITFTKDYLKAFDEALAASKSATELQSKIKAKYPDTALEVIVKIGSEAAFQKPKAEGAASPAATSKLPASDKAPKPGTTPAQ
jgi:glyoxylase-like metal-dependent hydrolase (beta-lactamase superfamily II)